MYLIVRSKGNGAHNLEVINLFSENDDFDRRSDDFDDYENHLSPTYDTPKESFKNDLKTANGNWEEADFFRKNFTRANFRQKEFFQKKPENGYECNFCSDNSSRKTSITTSVNKSDNPPAVESSFLKDLDYLDNEDVDIIVEKVSEKEVNLEGKTGTQVDVNLEEFRDSEEKRNLEDEVAVEEEGNLEEEGDQEECVLNEDDDLRVSGKKRKWDDENLGNIKDAEFSDVNKQANIVFDIHDLENEYIRGFNDGKKRRKLTERVLDGAIGGVFSLTLACTLLFSLLDA
ncbi:hypothetical protein HK099_004044 [Clydaea vesicula]|uniref:Uncharacterized protein n=1 Tax=Clydaea vesicula TaxID=447962 RepID=A0AAD5U2U4_9FUNG|nr:hypothetical protein HK099_004044 [Clydaea vesicula]